jgi:hypothetical protein
MAEEKLIGLSGNGHQRRYQFKKLCAEYGKENVTKIDNPRPKNRTKCKNTFAKVVFTVPQIVQGATA